MGAWPRTTGLRRPWMSSILSGHHLATAALLSLSRSDPSGRNPACPPNGPLTMKTKHHLGLAFILSGIGTTIFTVSLSGASRARQQEPTTKTQTDKVEHEMVTRQAVCRWANKPVQMSSAPLTQLNFHRYEDFGTLRFEGPRAEK